MHPELEPNFFTSTHDDVSGVMQSMGIEPARPRSEAGAFVYGLATLPGMVSVMVAAVVGAIWGLVAAGFGAPPPAIVLLGIAGFGVAAGILVPWQRRDTRRSSAFGSRFPSPPKSPT
jgi:xanthosine utilization system XapX-like protein